MPVKGLLITLDQDPEKAASALSLLTARKEVELGEQKEKYLPLVIDTGTEQAGKQLQRWIESLDGVYYVDTVFASVEEPE